MNILNSINKLIKECCCGEEQDEEEEEEIDCNELEELLKQAIEEQDEERILELQEVFDRHCSE